MAKGINNRAAFISAMTALLVMVLAGVAFATTCMTPSCPESLARSDVVFRGKAIASGRTSMGMKIEHKIEKGGALFGGGLPNTYTDFEVSAVYKGLPGAKVRIYYETRSASMIAGDYDVDPFEDGKEMTIFAKNSGGFLVTYVGLCSGHGCAPGDLETIRRQYEAIEGLIQKFPKTPEFYTKKISLYEGNKDYAGAVFTYEKLFAALPDLKADKALQAGYGRDLQLGGRLEESLKALAQAGETPGAASDTQLSLLQLGRAAELSGKKPKLSGQQLSDITIKDTDFSGADFSGAVLQRVKFINVKLRGANFKGAKMQGEIEGCDAAGADFSGAELSRTKIGGSGFDGASFAGAGLDLDVTSGNSFQAADFTDAKLHIMEGRFAGNEGRGNDFSRAKFVNANIGGIGGSKTTGADFTGASFYSGRSPSSRNQGLDLSGQKLDGSNLGSSDFTGSSFKGASLRNTGFTGSNLKSVDFSGADLTGADFGVSSYSGPTKLHGANFTDAKTEGVRWDAADYDCTTKFPAGFSPAENFLAAKAGCEGAKTGSVDYSWEKMLQPPSRHYRLMAEKESFQFKDADFTGANFEGMRLGTFFDSNLKGANLRHTKGGLNVGGSLEGADLSYAELGRGHYHIEKKPSAKGAKLFCTNMRDIVSSADFSEADWTGALMNSLNFSKWPDKMPVDPIKSKVIFINMQDVIEKFGPADFSGMDFTGCDFNYIRFATSNLSGVRFKGAYLYSTDFSDANLTNANFDGARLTASTKFPANFDKSKFRFIPTSVINNGESSWAASRNGTKSHLLGMYSPPVTTVPDFPGEDFSKLEYPAAWLPGSNLKGAKMRFTDWRASNLTGANMSGADATGAVFWDALLDNADLSGANLTGADFRKASLQGAKLEGATLKNALYDENTSWPQGFDPQKSGAFLVKTEKKSPY